MGFLWDFMGISIESRFEKETQLKVDGYLSKSLLILRLRFKGKIN
jgi:hypothetical protein